ncbi:hypothetical protein [Pseudoalteromonas rhizosphaerae]|uniref:hypothetical protein n=1 Tax=Pseudoalteromonas rhizosphaerae TaxID=2518973 RepID=UPI00384E7717
MEVLEFRQRLQTILVNELKMWRHRLCNQTMLVFDFGCFAWHGYFELSFLTNDEPEMEMLSRDVNFMAQWRLYDFTSTYLSKWPQATELAIEMQQSYESASEPSAKADEFFLACADVVKSREVKEMLATYSLANDFEMRVLNSDDTSNKNYCNFNT